MSLDRFVRVAVLTAIVGALVATQPSPTVHAQFATIDVAAIAQMIKQYAVQIEQKKAMYDQIMNQKKQIEQYVQMLEDSKHSFGNIVGSFDEARGMALALGFHGCSWGGKFDRSLNTIHTEEIDAALAELRLPEDALINACNPDISDELDNSLKHIQTLDTRIANGQLASNAARGDANTATSGAKGLLKASATLEPTTASAQKTAANTALSAMMLRSSVQAQSFIVEELIAQNQLRRDELQASVNYEQRRQAGFAEVRNSLIQPTRDMRW